MASRGVANTELTARTGLVTGPGRRVISAAAWYRVVGDTRRSGPMLGARALAAGSAEGAGGCLACRAARGWAYLSAQRMPPAP